MSPDSVYKTGGDIEYIFLCPDQAMDVVTLTDATTVIETSTGPLTAVTHRLSLTQVNQYISYIETILTSKTIMTLNYMNTYEMPLTKDMIATEFKINEYNAELLLKLYDAYRLVIKASTYMLSYGTSKCTFTIKKNF